MTEKIPASRHFFLFYALQYKKLFAEFHVQFMLFIFFQDNYFFSHFSAFILHTFCYPMKIYIFFCSIFFLFPSVWNHIIRLALLKIFRIKILIQLWKKCSGKHNNFKKTNFMYFCTHIFFRKKWYGVAKSTSVINGQHKFQLANECIDKAISSHLKFDKKLILEFCQLNWENERISVKDIGIQLNWTWNKCNCFLFVSQVFYPAKLLFFLNLFSVEPCHLHASIYFLFIYCFASSVLIHSFLLRSIY